LKSRTQTKWHALCGYASHQEGGGTERHAWRRHFRHIQNNNNKPASIAWRNGRNSMSTASETFAGGIGGSGLLDRERIIAKPGFNRWLVPPAALAIHLCIGMAYGFSVFWLPLSKSIGITQSVACADLTLVSALFTTTCDWRVADLGWIYTLFFVLLGSSAAIWGGWLERSGPRKAGVVSAVCWCGGIAIAAVGVMTHQLWLMWLGAGVIGGICLGLG
jgi:hypothetical protein